MRPLPPLCLALALLSPTAARADGKAAVKQAEALIAEQENDIPKALGLLREAAAASPDDIDIAFDRARLALEHANLSQPDDLDAYLKVEAITADQRVLRAYILAARGRNDEARSAATEAAKADPTNTEAQGLVEALTPTARGDQAKRDIVGRVRLFGQYDTNVSVLPDRTSTSVGSTTQTSDATAFQRSAAAVAVEGDVRWVPIKGPTELSFLGGASFLGHVNGRNDATDAATGNVKQGSKLYDFGTIDLQARLAFPRERWNSAIELYGSSVFIDDFQTRYLTEGTLLGSTNVAVDDGKHVRFGAYGLGGLRSFGHDFSVRDGTREEGGLTFDYTTRRAGIGLRASYQAEITDSKNFTEKGPQGMFYARGSAGRFDALVSFTYQRRAYDSVVSTPTATSPTSTTFDRNDSRFGPQAQLAYGLSDTLTVLGIYQYIHNDSTVTGYPADFGYSRHLATVGIEARL